MEEKNLTDEQKKFLEECENQFKDRYTEKDIEFMKVKNMELKKPPIIDPWYPRRKRYFFPQERGEIYRNSDRYYSQRYRPYNY